MVMFIVMVMVVGHGSGSYGSGGSGYAIGTPLQEPAISAVVVGTFSGHSILH